MTRDERYSSTCILLTFKRVNEEVDLDHMVSPAGGYICPG